MKVDQGETLHFCTENSPEVVARQMVKDQERLAALEAWIAIEARHSFSCQTDKQHGLTCSCGLDSLKR